MFGSVGDMYASVETLDAAYLAPGASKDALVAPSPEVSANARSLLGLPDPTVFFFQCQFECPGNYLTDATGVNEMPVRPQDDNEMPVRGAAGAAEEALQDQAVRRQHGGRHETSAACRARASISAARSWRSRASTFLPARRRCRAEGSCRAS
jgi:hypothetical protein